MSNDTSDDRLSETASEPVNGWARLRAEREARGLSLAQVSAHLKLTARQIEAIECGDLSALPGAAFSRGFVRNYARFLQLDPAPFVALIDAVEGQHAALPTEVYSTSLGRMPTAGNPRFSALPAAALVLVLAALLGAGWYYHWFEAREDAATVNAAQSLAEANESSPVWGAVAVASAPQTTQSSMADQSAAASAPAVAASATTVPTAPQSVATPGAVAQSVSPATQSAVSRAMQSAPQTVQSAPKPVVQSAPVTSASATPGLPRIVLSFEGDSWVDVRDATGKTVFSRLNQAGALQEVQGTAPFTLVIGNAPKVKLTWKGRPLDLTPYTKGDVARLTVQ